MNLRKFSAALLAVAMMGSLAACGSKNSNSSSASSSSTTKLDADQTLTVDLRAEPSTMDPNKCSDFYGITVLMNTMENLTRLEENKDGSNTVKPAGAKSWETSDDGTGLDVPSAGQQVETTARPLPRRIMNTVMQARCWIPRWALSCPIC
jgi:oligopeptide transport system substrate-binding protein